MTTIAPYLKRLVAHDTLTHQEMTEVISTLLDGGVNDIEAASFLTALSLKGIHKDDLVAAASAMRNKALHVHAPEGAIDCCGTGGDHSGSLNISTAVSFVVAACGVPVAKHGNRAATSKSGAADVLEALGLNLDVSVETLENTLKNENIAFLMAPHHHKALKHLADIRKTLGFRTLFNALGPLANPANVKRQLVGVYDRSLLCPMAEALKALGSDAVWVVHSDDGMDEISISASTAVCELKTDGLLYEFEISPEDFGLTRYTLADIKGGDAAYNADKMKNLFQGESSAYKDIVCLNAAAALVVSGKAHHIKEGVEMAAHALDSGQVMATFEHYKQATLI